MSAMSNLLRELDAGIDAGLLQVRKRMDTNTASAADYALYTQALIAKMQIKQALDANPPT